MAVRASGNTPAEVATAFLRAGHAGLVEHLLPTVATSGPVHGDPAALVQGWLSTLESRLVTSGRPEAPAAWIGLGAEPRGREAAEKLSGRLCAATVAWLGREGARAGVDPEAVGEGAAAAAAAAGDLVAAVGSGAQTGRWSPNRVRQQQRLVDLLLTGSFDDERPLRRMAMALGVRMEPEYIVAVLADAPADLSGLELDRTASLVGRDAQGMTVLVLCRSQETNRRAGWGQILDDYVKQNPGALAGVGTAAQSLAQVGKSHLEACEALAFSRVRQSDGLPAEGLSHFADAALFSALREHPRDVALYVESVLGPASEHPSFRRLDLAVTLRHYLETASISQTARRLRLHKQTVAYRVARAGQLLKVDLTRQADRFRVYLALLLRPIAR
ncbi:MAG: PucR family transcriptional regulator [Candidatus Dormibacteria bacterium]